MDAILATVYNLTLAIDRRVSSPPEGEAFYVSVALERRGSGRPGYSMRANTGRGAAAAKRSIS
jgi:hypothetical protein